MDPVPGITTTTSPFAISANAAIARTSALLAPDTSRLTLGLLGGASTVVELSGLGQVLSAAATFADQLAALQPGAATSGGGQNFGTDLASLAAEAQSFVDAFNGLQSNIANSNSIGSLLGGGVAGTAGLASTLDAEVQTNFANGSSNLTRLSQIGITFQPARFSGGGSLSIDLGTLESAFNTDAAGTFSLLARAATAFGEVAGNFISQAVPQFSALSVLAQTSAADQFFNNSLLSPTLPNGGFNFADLLALESSLLANPASNNAPSLQQIVLATNEFALVSTLLG